VDPSVRCSGYAIIDGPSEREMRALAFGSLPQPPRSTQADALANLHATLTDLITQHSPTVLAMEKIIFVQSIRTAISMGSARGVVLAAAGQAGLSVHEYPARLVKQAATGRGGAQKGQVAFMMRALFSLKSTPDSDAADALAIALTHLRQAARQMKGA